MSTQITNQWAGGSASIAGMQNEIRDLSYGFRMSSEAAGEFLKKLSYAGMGGDTRRFAAEMLSREYQTGQPILVHCAAGMQRSAAVVAMFLIATQGMKWESAIEYIRQRRPIAFYPSANFLQAIQGFEKTLQGMFRNT
jgi:hypothetical protein